MNHLNKHTPNHFTSKLTDPKFNSNKKTLKAQNKKQETNVKFKTELCRNFELGFCEFGHKCFFAHSLEEIRGKPVLVSVKCANFFANGYCINGIKCEYSHRDLSPETAANSPKHSKKVSRTINEDTYGKVVFIDLESRKFDN